MKHFHFLTENAYVQTGSYKVRKFYRQGKHFLQGVGNITTGGTQVATAFPYTSDKTGLFKVNFTATNGAGSGDATFTLKAGAEVVATVTVAASGSTPVSTFAEIPAGATLALTTSGGNAPAASAITIVFTGDFSYPETFSADWAVFSDGHDNVKGYDPASYSIGLKPHETIVTVPLLKKVSLLYFVSDISTQEQKTLVQFDGDLSDLDAAGLVVDNSDGTASRIAWTEEEYIARFSPKGFNRFGKVLPKGIAESHVSELSSFTGSFATTDGSVQTVTAYFNPVYMYNALPIFDYVYLTNGFAGDFSGDWAGIPGYFLRWLGGATSENIAPINRWGEALERDGYLYDTDNKVVTTPSDQFVGENGVTYTGAEEYNIRNYRRY